MMAASGWSSDGGWWLSGTAEGDEFVSIHESLHYRLDRSTSYGALLYVLKAIDEEGARERDIRALRDACRTVHESFASYVSRLVVPAGINSVDHSRYERGMGEMVATCTSAFFRLHAALAIARACMQVDIVRAIARLPLADISASSFRARDRPDERFRLLRQMPPNFGEVEDALLASSDGDWLLAQNADGLASESLAPEFHGQWERTAAAFYDSVTASLAAVGIFATAIDDNVPTTELLLRRASEEHPQTALAIGQPSDDPVDRLWQALAGIDAEMIDLPPHRAYRVNWTSSLDLDMVTAGGGDETHLHIAIRRPPYDSAFDWQSIPPNGPVCLRRTLMGETGRTIELIDITDFDPSSFFGEDPPPISVTVAESALSDPRVTPWWSRFRADAVLLADTPLIPRLRSWLDGEGKVFRFAFLLIEAGEVELPVLICALELEDMPVPNLLVRPMSRHNVGLLRQGLRELEARGYGIIEDSEIVARSPMLGFGLFHVVGEDSEFGRHERALRDR